MFRRLTTENRKAIPVTLNGKAVTAYEGDTVAAVALANGMRATRTTPVSGASRGPYCAMGVCFECLMVIDGKANQRACMTTVCEGMDIRLQRGAGDANADT